MPASQSVKLNTGVYMPTVGFGTWKSEPGVVGRATTIALECGFRSIDTATDYGNEAEVGEGIKDSNVPRSEIFLTTKLKNCDHRDIEGALNRSLARLKTDYLDLWLLHWPAPMNADCTQADKSLDWLDTWKAMVEVYKANPQKIHALGVSNLSVKFMTRLLGNSDIVPAVNQIELHPSCPQEELVEFCRTRGIVVTGYSPLGSNDSPLLTNPIVVNLAQKYNVQPANILVSVQANRPGVNVLTKSVTEARIRSNLKVVDLTQEELAELQSIDKTSHFRVCHPSWTGWGSLGFPDCLESDQ
ncbi:hypothetical protein Ac2012v2_006626 [Leucoagaricus gongylophorus]